MTNSLARLIALPFVLILIFSFASGGLEFTGPKTILILLSLISLALIYVFNEAINKWWWRRRPPPLDRALKSWIERYSKYYSQLDPPGQKIFLERISVFIHIKNFTLKVDRDYQLEEDIKTIIAHEYVRLTFHNDEFLFEGIDTFIVYNHPFGTPDNQTLHALELHREDRVVILSKEQLVNGFLQPEIYVNTGLLSAVMSFILLYPRLEYPEVLSLDSEDVAEAHGIQLDVIKKTLGVDWINRLDLLIFCFWMYPDRTASFDPDRYEKLCKIFG